MRAPVGHGAGRRLLAGRYCEADANDPQSAPYRALAPQGGGLRSRPPDQRASGLPAALVIGEAAPANGRASCPQWHLSAPGMRWPAAGSVRLTSLVVGRADEHRRHGARDDYPGRGAVVAVFAVTGSWRPVGQHHRQPGRAVLQSGAIRSAAADAETARPAGAGRQACRRRDHGGGVAVPVAAAQQGGRRRPALRAADRRDQSAAKAQAADQAEPSRNGAPPSRERAALPDQTATPLDRRLTAAAANATTGAAGAIGQRSRLSSPCDLGHGEAR